jgi:hypothetical protein
LGNGLDKSDVGATKDSRQDQGRSVHSAEKL